MMSSRGREGVLYRLSCASGCVAAEKGTVETFTSEPRSLFIPPLDGGGAEKLKMRQSCFFWRVVELSVLPLENKL